MYRIMNVEPESIQSICPECPDALAAVLARLLSKDPEKRYQNFEDMLFDTAPILRDLESSQADQLATQAQEAHSQRTFGGSAAPRQAHSRS